MAVNYLSAAPEAELRGRKEEMEEFPDERSAVRDAVWFVCLSVGPDGQAMAYDDRIADLADRYSYHPVTEHWLRLGEPEMKAASDRTAERLREHGLGSVVGGATDEEGG